MSSQDHQNEQEEGTMLGPVFAALVALSLAVGGLALLIWWLWRLWEGDRETATVQAIEIKADPVVETDVPSPVAAEVEAVAVETEAAAEQAPVAVTPDDLKRIEGIGPKTESLLQAGGILTYAQLAECSPEQIRELIAESDPRLARIANPDTWPQQASLAAADDWEGLEKLKGELKAGQRT